MPIRQLNIFYASSEAAHETAEQKIKKLIEAGIDGLVNEERRRLNNQKATFEG